MRVYFQHGLHAYLHRYLVNFSSLTYLLRTRFRSPDVIVDFVCEAGHLFVTLENIGDGPAHHVTATFEPELRGGRGTRVVSSLPLFEKMPFLAPRRRIRVFVDALDAYFDRDAPTQFAVTVQFADDGGTRHTRTITHDLRVYRGLGDPQAASSRPDGTPASRQLEPTHNR